MEVRIPSRFDQNTLGNLFACLDATRDIDNVNVDFSDLRYSYPTAMLVAGSKLRDWVGYRTTCGYQSTRSGISASISAHSYLMHLGFFDFIHMEEGNRVGGARGSARYLPVTRIERPAIDVMRRGLDEWYSAIQSEARRLAGVLCGSHDDSEALRTYTYSLREIIRNVFEHSQANECFICGQRWHNGRVEVALIDEGVGIVRSIATAYPIEFDDDALSLAIRPGVTRTRAFDAVSNIYDNSGFGLYVLTQLASSFGWFVLGSGTAQIVGHQQVRTSSPSSFKGTYFGMRLERPPHDFASVLRDIIESGEDEARMSGVHVRASGRSRFAE